MGQRHQKETSGLPPLSPIPAQVLIDVSLFRAKVPQFKSMPDTDARVMVMHVLGFTPEGIAVRTNRRKEFIVSVIDKYDPDRSLAMTEPIKMAIAKGQLVSMLSLLASSFEDMDKVLALPPEKRLAIIEQLVRVVGSIKVEPQKGKEDDGANDAKGAIGRLARGSDQNAAKGGATLP